MQNSRPTNFVNGLLSAFLPSLRDSDQLVPYRFEP
jgi:hypothetical protein